MTLGKRIEQRISDLGISQSELARRVKVPQTTINSLVRAERRSSPHLHRIARELGTTPEFLTGETDDPDEGAPPEPRLSHTARELLRAFDALGAAQQTALLTIALSMIGEGPTGQVQSPKLQFQVKGERG